MLTHCPGLRLVSLPGGLSSSSFLTVLVYRVTQLQRPRGCFRKPRIKPGGVCNPGTPEAEARRLLEFRSSRPAWATWEDSHLKQERLRKLSVVLSVHTQAPGCPSGSLSLCVPHSDVSVRLGVWLDLPQPSRAGEWRLRLVQNRQSLQPPSLEVWRFAKSRRALL